MPQTDAEDGHFAYQLLYLGYGKCVLSRVTGAVGKHDAVRVITEHSFGRCFAWNNCHLASPAAQRPYYISLCTIVYEHHIMLFLSKGRVDSLFFAGHRIHHIGHGKLIDCSKIFWNPVADHGIHHSLFPYQAGKLTGIYTADSRYSLLLEIFIKLVLTPEVGRGVAEFPDHISFQGALSLEVFLNHSVVSYQRKGLDHYLSRIAGICEGFKISFHIGGEYQLSQALSRGSYLFSLENLSVSKN